MLDNMCYKLCYINLSSGLYNFFTDILFNSVYTYITSYIACNMLYKRS